MQQSSDSSRRQYTVHALLDRDLTCGPSIIMHIHNTMSLNRLEDRFWSVNEHQIWLAKIMPVNWGEVRKVNRSSPHCCAFLSLMIVKPSPFTLFHFSPSHSAWLTFWAFSRETVYLLLKSRHQGECRLLLWYQKTEQHSTLNSCHLRSETEREKQCRQTVHCSRRRQLCWCRVWRCTVAYAIAVRKSNIDQAVKGEFQRESGWFAPTTSDAWKRRAYLKAPNFPKWRHRFIEDILPDKIFVQSNKVESYLMIDDDRQYIFTKDDFYHSYHFYYFLLFESNRKCYKLTTNFPDWIQIRTVVVIDK